jgi:dihydroorotate dehydrogenase electron transfer subunit
VVLDVQGEVVANRPLSDDSNVVEIRAAELASLVQPGQFVMVRATESLEPLLRRPFSVFEVLRHADGTPAGISLLNKRVGVVSAMLFGAWPGQRLGCLGPLGRPFAPVGPPLEAWMVAGGVGLAPFMTLAESLAARGTRLRLFYGGRRAVDVVLADLFARLGVEVVVATEDGSRGEHGLVTHAVARRLTARSAGQPVVLYACGPTAMMREVARLGAKHGHPVQVSLEPTMGCGLGGCYSCVVAVRRNGAREYLRSCLDGPVFDASVVAWDDLERGD